MSESDAMDNRYIKKDNKNKASPGWGVIKISVDLVEINFLHVFLLEVCQSMALGERRILEVGRLCKGLLCSFC